MGAPILRLVSSEGCAVAPAPTASVRAPRSQLREEAETLEIQFGPNAYADYLRKNGVLPDPETAATIGRLVGGRVKASDGSLQPALTEADRAYRRAAKKRRAEWYRKADNIHRLKSVIALLCQCDGDPGELIKAGGFDDPLVREQLDFAVAYLKRFAEECSGNEARPKGAKRLETVGG
jgi:hypothetical protein